jgi:DNA-binding NtrC family response regulator
MREFHLPKVTHRVTTGTMELQRTYDQSPPDRDLGPTVLIVDDDELCRATLRSACSSALRENSFRLLDCSNLGDAIRILSENEVHVVLLDKNLGEDNGITAIPRLLSCQLHLQILMVTGSNDDQDIVAAMKNGAFGYVIKGSNPTLLVEQIKKAVRYAHLAQSSIRQSAAPAQNKRTDLVGQSAAISLLKRQVEALAKTETPVLLLGETGTGKTTVAKQIHEMRQTYLKQENRPWIHLNMAAMPEELAERELFGAEKGAYTGSVESKPGSIELAHGGTLFLDELGDASLALQAKLLTVLDNGVFKRLGATQTKKSSFRLICATNKDLESLVRTGKFREDLFMRISTISIRLPSLGERREDIPELIRSLLARCCERSGVKVAYSELPVDFIEYLKEAPIQGNIRGIEQQLERLLLFAPRDPQDRPTLRLWRSIPGLRIHAKEVRMRSGRITLDELLERKLDVVGDRDFPGLYEFVDLVTRQLFLEGTEKYDQSQELARAFRVSPALVCKKLQELGISPRARSRKRIAEEARL